LYKGDAARTSVAVAERPASGINIYNVSAPACTMREIVDGIADALGKLPFPVRTINAIEAFANFGCIATGILQIISLNFHQTIWRKYSGWLRTVTSTVLSEEIVKSVIQQENYHNFRFFRYTAIYRIIMSKSKHPPAGLLPLAA